MRTGIMIMPFGGEGNAVETLLEQARAAAASGVGTLWLPQLLGMDALTALALIGREVPDVALGTAVVATYPRHPIALAGQALTVQAATHGRLHLGIGLSHRRIIEETFGLSFDRPVRHLREYLAALLSLLSTGEADLHGEMFTASTGGRGVAIDGASPPPVLVAALGTQMLRATGELADGTVTWMVGPKTLSGHIAPTINAAAAAAGRPAPRVVVGALACVTSDVAGATERAASAFGVYQNIPSYKAMLDREGASAAELAVIGDEETVAKGLRHLMELGATEILATTAFATPEEQARTWALLGSLNS